MNRNQKIIVSITGIFLVLMILVGLTYAYFLTKITGNTNTKSISVSTANLVLEYGENTNVVQGISNAEPGYSVEKIFTATNKGNSTVTYGAALESIVNGLTRQEDLVYTLTCTSYLKEAFSLASDGTITGTVDGTCNGVSSETTFPSTSDLSIMVNNTIDTTHTHAYKLTITYKEMGVDQSTDMNKTFSAKVNIVDLNAIARNNPYEDNKSSLAYNIINNAINKTNGTELVGTPKTIPAEEISGHKYYTDKVKEATSESSIRITTTYQGYYWTYGTGYTIDENTGKFTLTGVSTCKYDDGTCNTILVGKYLGTVSASSNSSSTDTQKTTTNLSKIYKVATAPASSTSSITMKVDKISSISYSIESVLSVTSDDYGISYYYRGGVEDNYVNFAGMCWRAVRIAGDGSIKLILEDQDNTCATSDGNWDIPTTTGGTTKTGNFGFTKHVKNTLTASDGTKNSGEITLMNYLNGGTNNDISMATAFKNFQTGPLANYLDKLKAGDWCLNDKAYASETDNTTALTSQEILDKQVKDTSFYYDSDVRLNGKTTKEPALKCNGTVMTKFADENNTDMYVGTLTADEIVYAGGKAYFNNPDYYLINDYQKSNGLYFWSLSPNDFGSRSDRAFRVEFYGMVISIDGSVYTGSDNSFRPAVSLKSSVQITGGNGTKANAYTIAS